MDFRTVFNLPAELRNSSNIMRCPLEGEKVHTTAVKWTDDAPWTDCQAYVERGPYGVRVTLATFDNIDHMREFAAHFNN